MPEVEKFGKLCPFVNRDCYKELCMAWVTNDYYIDTSGNKIQITPFCMRLSGRF